MTSTGGPRLNHEFPARNPWVDRYSAGVGIGLQAFPLPDSPEPSRQLIDAGKLADELGLDGFFIGDHPAYAPEAWLHLAALATRTQDVQLGSVVFCAAYRHPAHLARLAADFDHLSNGRLVLGLGIGWNGEEFGQLGLDLESIPKRQLAFEEFLTILLGSWTGEPFDFAGTYWQTTAASVRPSPLQRPRPPIVIAGSGERTTLRQVAEFADACNFGPGRNTGAVLTPEDYVRKYEILRHYCEAIGRPYDDILRTQFTTWLMLAPSQEEAIAKRDRYYPDGLNPDQQVTRIVGTPEQAIGYYQELIDAGVQYIVCQILDASDLETIELLATEVAPRLRMFSNR
jgi:alkanesulfonate monooxygenase SsuD/methylene tetrahydromethanopterin reductase-like flavin-dependent oxidoreductase (luciferase family)